MAHHMLVESSGKIIIEGDGILPILAKQNTFVGVAGFENIAPSQKVCAVFLIEDNETEIQNNLRERDRGFGSTSKDVQSAFARASWLYGQWLVQEGQHHQISILRTRPKETVVERAL